jgi:hypothetical protein
MLNMLGEMLRTARIDWGVMIVSLTVMAAFGAMTLAIIVGITQSSNAIQVERKANYDRYMAQCLTKKLEYECVSDLWWLRL